MGSTLAGEGSAAVFERLYRRHRGDVYRFVLRDVRNADDAEDVTQTAFLNAYRALQRGDEPEKPRAWLFTIAQNVARRRFRARAARPQEVELDPDVVMAPVAEGPTAGEIREALQRLRPNHRAVIVLREIGGFSYAEIAETLGLTVAAVETLLFRARRALREQLTVEERTSLRAGGFALPLPAGLSDWLGSLAGWLGRRAVAVKVAGALGAGVLATGVAVQSGAVAMPGAGGEAVAAFPPAAREAADLAERRTVEPLGERRAKRADRARPAKARETSRAEKTRSGASGVLGVPVPDLPDVALPQVAVPEVSVPELTLPAVEVPPVPVDVPEVGAQALPVETDLLP